MLGALIIVFREVFEAGLVVGILLAATKLVSGSRWWIAGGVAGGVAGSVLLAFFAGAVSRWADGFGQELFDAGVLAVAVVMLIWHNLWMAHHGRELAAHLMKAGSEVEDGSRPLAALAIVVGVAVLREGAEVALFMYGIVLAGGESWTSLALGSVAGLALGACVSALTYFGLVKIPMRHLFSVTTLLITFLAAAMASQSAAFLEKAGKVSWLSATAWDTSWILDENSMLGRVMHTMIGYAQRPSELQVLVYLVTLLAVAALTFATARHAKTPQAAASR
ncbi:FTR1 family protein [Rhizobium sp. L1K21]|uniref:FTR1 family iron permease n=1 Tax=Rhizobium sp. L1K21 TaxID=2954933 RepID=UPI002093761C|nr:FTR1 family protein [Rhizobium sp. L1K21]MCO6187189.1 FTR1 family protein [Rhizobium sp. L1K21]